MLAVIRGAGDVATGIALRLRRARVQVDIKDVVDSGDVSRRLRRIVRDAKEEERTLESVIGQ